MVVPIIKMAAPTITTHLRENPDTESESDASNESINDISDENDEDEERGFLNIMDFRSHAVGRFDATF